MSYRFVEVPPERVEYEVEAFLLRDRGIRCAARFVETVQPRSGLHAVAVVRLIDHPTASRALCVSADVQVPRAGLGDTVNLVYVMPHDARDVEEASEHAIAALQRLQHPERITSDIPSGANEHADEPRP